MRKIVINKCFGEFDLSTEAKVALYVRVSAGVVCRCDHGIRSLFINGTF